VERIGKHYTNQRIPKNHGCGAAPKLLSGTGQFCRNTANASKILIHRSFYDSADYSHKNRKMANTVLTLFLVHSIICIIGIVHR